MRNVAMCFALLALIAISIHAFGQPAPSTQDGPSDVKPAPPTPDQDGVYRVGPGIEPPTMTKSVAPEYPAGAEPGFRRRFLFRVVVGADGALKLRDVSPNDQSPALDNAIAAIKASTFQPGTLGGRPVPVLVCVTALFSPFRPPSTQIVDCNDQRFWNQIGGSASSASDEQPLRFPPGTKPPVPIHTVEAEFSNEARAEHFQGVVVVSALVDVEGMPTDISIERSAGHGLDEKAVAAVSQYRFRPATLDGKPIAVRIRIEVSFRFRD